MSTPATAGYTLAQIDADLAEARATVYSPRGMDPLRAAERLREYVAAVEVALAASQLTAHARLARITVATSRLRDGTL